MGFTILIDQKDNEFGSTTNGYYYTFGGSYCMTKIISSVFPRNNPGVYTISGQYSIYVSKLKKDEGKKPIISNMSFYCEIESQDNIKPIEVLYTKFKESLMLGPDDFSDELS